MSERELVVRTYSEWTVLSALWVGSPIRSKKQVYRAVRRIDFNPVTDTSLGPIDPMQFEKWHAGALRQLSEIEPKLRGQVGWSAKIINVYLKTYAYIGDQGRPNLRNHIHPPIDSGLWKGIKRKFSTHNDILADTHCVHSIGAITTPEIYARVIKGLRASASELKCSLIEVEQLWEGTRVPK